MLRAEDNQPSTRKVPPATVVCEFSNPVYESSFNANESEDKREEYEPGEITLQREPEDYNPVRPLWQRILIACCITCVWTPEAD
ncbi:Protein of unknown function [Gryllus bimaculatus]|nr:Protein of unknown function [Gryllus bimaculatus]